MAKLASNLTLTLYSAPECHLCDDALALLQPYIDKGTSLAKLDITLDPLLLANYRTRIPVVAAADQELGWPFDAEQLASWLKTLNN